VIVRRTTLNKYGDLNYEQETENMSFDEISERANGYKNVNYILIDPSAGTLGGSS